MEPKSQVANNVGMHFLIDLIKELRPKQWTKNLLVFASAIFAGNFLESVTFLNAIIAFFSFSFIASTIYVINDIVDVEKDKVHPDKCNRPIARGAITIPIAVCLAVCTFIISIILSYNLGIVPSIIVLVYFIINLMYSMYLKHVVIIDVMIIAFGFVLRALMGALAVNGSLTSWFILCTLGLSLFLALGKRRHELQLFNVDSKNGRKVLESYSVEMLDQLMTMITAVIIMFYSMYAASQGKYMMFTIPLVLYGIFRYYYLIHKKSGGGKPEDTLLNDRHILVTVILFGLSVLLIKGFL
ncbi:decaprenyl-phosphate phosphoribosyltransferase [Paenibacillus hubeiensis]|uniref:decaprenyl-phosphate phosphoribosyltransferase n=1 Tax=Paenibacillus hubeiensis TaxID=3077330 RepID=UPI0031B9C16C